MKSTIIASVFAVALIGAAFMLSGNDSWQAANVSVKNGTQEIEITAKGEYSPKLTEAKANMPAVIHMKTNGTYDCTSALSVPAANFENTLAPTGITKIEIPPQKPGAIVQGTCAMGMYDFSIKFI